MDPIAIGKRLKEVRGVLHKTLREMSRLARTSLGGISDMEKGKIKPSVNYLYGLAVKFNINIIWVLTGKGSMYPADIELHLDYGKDNEMIKELIFCLQHENIARFDILRNFAVFKRDNPDIIEKIRELMDAPPG